jgi:hypothetical protein
MGRNKKTILAFTDSMNSIKAILPEATLDERYAEIAPNLVPAEQEALSGSPAVAR